MTATTAPDPATLRALLDGEHARDPRPRPRVALEPGNAPVADLPIEEHREQVLAWATRARLAGRHRDGLSRRVRRQGRRRPRRSRRFETLAFGDLSLLVKCGVQFGLFGGAVLHLGTERHHERYLARRSRAGAARLLRDDRDRPRLQRPGAAARPRPTTRRPSEFVVHTPDDDARKDYIGNAARDGRMAAVFAQLDRRRRGARRARAARPDPRRGRQPCSTASGSRTAAPKLGLNGVDNGRIWFDHVRVPREALLDRYAQVAADGTYFEPDREPDQALLHDARHADPGPRERLRRVDQRDQGRARRSPSGAR